MSEFNIATKMSECPASGPKHAAMIRFIGPYKAAWIESALTIDSLAANISSRLSFENRKERLTYARDLVQRVLSTTAMRQRWLSVLSSMTLADGNGRRE